MKTSTVKDFIQQVLAIGVDPDLLPFAGTLCFLHTHKLDIHEFESINPDFAHANQWLQQNNTFAFEAISSGQMVLKNADDVLYICEQSLSSGEVKNFGAVYTPKYIVDEILRTTLSELPIIDWTQNLVFDPCCGAGNFLFSATRYISDKLGVSLSDASAYVAGMDIDPKAIRNAQLAMDAMCYQACGTASQVRLVENDAATGSIPQQLDALNASSGFAVIATNPPYVKLQTLPEEYRLSIENENREIVRGSYSLATVILARIPEYLSTNGVAGVITMNNVFTSISGLNLRRLWRSSRQLRTILDFRHFKVFEASAYTCLLTVSRSENPFLRFAAVNEPPPDVDFESLVYSEIEFESLDDSKWRLTNADNQALLQLLEQGTFTLSDFADIRVGIATLADKAFIVRNDGGSWSATGGDGVQRALEGDLIRSLVKVSELPMTKTNYIPSGVIFPYVLVDGTKFYPLSLDEIESKYPVTFEHLVSWKALLEKPSRKNLDIHEWGRRQGMSAPGPKLLTKTFDKRPNFYIDETASLFSNGYSITVKAPDNDDQVLLIGLKHYLESRFMQCYALMTSFEISGGFQCYQKNFIEKIVLPSREILRAISGPIASHSKTEILIGKDLGIEVSQLDSCMSDYHLGES